MLKSLRSFGVGDANQLSFLLFAICGFCTVLNADLRPQVSLDVR